MSVNFEIKGMLAKCLAMEDIIIEHKKVETACFNVHTRVLTLPMWEKASDNIYTMLVLHEISHALWTPNYDWTQEYNIPGQFVNIVEDARIEKFCKRKYPGSPKSFYKGYQELSDNDFFQIGDDDLSTYNLADRANLFFKIGNYINLEFTDEEKEIINMIGSAETFTEVLNAAEVLYKYCKQKKEEETKIQIDNLESQSSGSDNQPASDFDDQEEGDNDQPESDNSESLDPNGDSQKQSVDSIAGGKKNEPEVKTMESLEESLKELVQDGGNENVYVEIPQVNLDNIIISNDKIHSICKEFWNVHIQNKLSTHQEIFGEVDKQFMEFRSSAQKEVNYLVKEFECRKAADSYARSSISRTGVLDCSRIHTYKYNEDLFKKVTTLADGKNHGLVFILDWSGSMSNVMMDTIKQLFNLVWFCKKVSIPFEVYAFTNDYPVVTYDSNNKAHFRKPCYEKKEGTMHLNEYFSLMNLLTSKVNGKTLEEQMKNIFRLAHAYKAYSPNYSIPGGLSLSGTPLNEAIVTLHQILPKFQKENKLQKVQCIILSDGEGNPLNYHCEIKRSWEKDPYMGTCSIGSNAFLRDRKTGNTYSFKGEWYHFTNVLLRNLRDKFPDTNFIGIRVLESRDVGTFIRRYCGYHGSDYDKVMSSWKKDKTFSIKTSGYHTYFGLSTNTLSLSSNFYVPEDASKGQIKSAFVKSLRSKKMNKKVLGEFVELIA